MVIIFISTQTETVNRREILSACRMIADKTRLDKDCKGFRIMLSADDENLIYMEQRWEHRSAMEKHFKSDLFGALIGAMEVLSKSWKIRINESLRTEGAETVEALRSKEK